MSITMTYGFTIFNFREVYRFHIKSLKMLKTQALLSFTQRIKSDGRKKWYKKCFHDKSSLRILTDTAKNNVKVIINDNQNPDKAKESKSHFQL